MSKVKTDKADFFISYTAADSEISSWIAWQLEDAGYSVVFQGWDFIPGSSFVNEMRGALEYANKMVAIISDAYFCSKFAMAEWDAAFTNDPDGLNRSLIPVRIENFDVSGLAKPRVYIDFVGCDEGMAKQKLLDGVKGKRLKPSTPPIYPFGNKTKEKPEIENTASIQPKPAALLETTMIDGDVYIPPVKKEWTDKDCNAFISDGFSKIQIYFEKAGELLNRQHPEIDVEIQPVTKRKFFCQIYVNGNNKNGCKIWISEQLGNRQIAYSEVGGHGFDNDNSYNEIFSVNNREDQLLLNATMFMFYGSSGKFDKERLLPEQAAEYLWKRVTASLSN